MFCAGGCGMHSESWEEGVQLILRDASSALCTGG